MQETHAMPSEQPPAPARPAPAAADPARFAEPQTLHPVSIVLGIPVVQLVQALLFPAAAVLATGGSLTLGILGLVVVIGTLGRAVAWQRFRWSFDGQVLRVSSGVLSRTHRSIDVGRIQQVEVDRAFAHRLVGVASVRIETAGSSSEPGIELRVLRERDAVALREAVRASAAAHPSSPHDAGGPDPVEVLRVPLRHVALAAVTGAQLFVLPAVLGASLQIVGGRLGELVERAVETGSRLLDTDALPTGALVAIGAGVLLVVSMVVAIGVAVVRDGRFAIDLVGRDLRVRRGLLGTRESTVPLARVQLVHIARNPLRRLLGVATVRIHSATGDSDRRITVPLVPDARVGVLLDRILGAVGLPELHPHPRMARRRALWRWLRRAAILGALPALALVVLPDEDLVRTLARIGPPALAVGAIALALVEWRALAHGVDDLLVASRRGALSLTTSVAPVAKIQAVSTRATWFQRRLGLQSVTAHVAGPGGDLEVLDAGTRQASRLHARLVSAAAGGDRGPGSSATAPDAGRTSAPLP
jgi:putative membrane protein